MGVGLPFRFNNLTILARAAAISVGDKAHALITVIGALARFIVFHHIDGIYMAVRNGAVPSAILFAATTVVTPLFINVFAIIRSKELDGENGIAFAELRFIAARNDVGEAAETIVGQPFIRHREFDIVRFPGDGDAFREGQQVAVVNDALQNVEDKDAGDQLRRHLTSNGAFLNKTFLALGFRFLSNKVIIHMKGLGIYLHDEIVCDMNLLGVCPANIDILAVTDHDTHSISVEQTIFLQHIGILVGHLEALAGTAQAYQGNASFVGSENFQGYRRSSKEFLKITEFAAVQLINGGEATHFFIQKTQLLVKHDRLGIRCITAFAELGEIDYLAGVAANGVDLRFQEEDLIIHGLDL